MATLSQAVQWVPHRLLTDDKFTFEIFKDARKAFEKQFPEYAYRPDAGDMDGALVDEDGLLFVEYMALTQRVQLQTTDPEPIPFTEENKRLAAFIVPYVTKHVQQQQRK